MKEKKNIRKDNKWVPEVSKRNVDKKLTKVHNLNKKVQRNKKVVQFSKDKGNFGKNQINF